MAIGAGPRELFRQFLTESTLLALGGGALGLLCSRWFVSLRLVAIPTTQLRAVPYLNTVKMDPTVLAFTFVVAVATGILFGLAPALDMSRADANQTLKDQARSSSGRGTSRLRDAFVVAEIGLAMMLLVGASLMLKSLTALLHADPGFRAENLLTFGIDLPSTSYKDDTNALRFEQRFSERIRRLPGVRGIATTSLLPLTGGGNTICFIVEGGPISAGNEDECYIRTITSGYFDVIKIALVKGRFFVPTDKADAPPRVVINQAFAREYFRGEDPLGKRIRFIFSPKQPFREIVGVAGNENAEQLNAAMPPILYTPFDQGPDGHFNYVVRTSGRPEELITPIRDVLRSEDPELPLIDPQTMEQIIAQSPAVFLWRYPSVLIGSFAGLALALAMVGLYGLISFSVAQRAHELGIRMALGAQANDVFRLS